MNKPAIALASVVAVLGATQAKATTVINSFYHIYEGYDYATGPSGINFGFPIDLHLGPVPSIKYTVTGVVTWSVPLTFTGPIVGDATVPIQFGLGVEDYDTGEPVGYTIGPFRRIAFNPESGRMVVSGPVSLSFSDDPSQYYPFGSNSLQFIPRASYPGFRIPCSGDCNWYIDTSVDQGISFGGRVMQTVTYANTISEPGSFALLTLGAFAAGFVATRRHQS